MPKLEELTFKFGKYWKAIQQVNCETCEREFTLYRSFIKRNGELKPSDYTPRCPDCQSQFTFEDEPVLNLHFNLHKMFSQWYERFTCAACNQTFLNETLLSTAKNRAELENRFTYCVNCFRSVQRESALFVNYQENMPTKKSTLKKKSPKTKTTKKNNQLSLVPARTRTTKTKTSPIDYYQCLMNYAQAGFYDPKEGKKQKIHTCCKKCKVLAPTLNNQRDKELVKLISSYKQVGESLAKLLQPVQ